MLSMDRQGEAAVAEAVPEAESTVRPQIEEVEPQIERELPGSAEVSPKKTDPWDFAEEDSVTQAIQVFYSRVLACARACVRVRACACLPACVRLCVCSSCRAHTVCVRVCADLLTQRPRCPDFTHISSGSSCRQTAQRSLIWRKATDCPHCTSATIFV